MRNLLSFCKLDQCAALSAVIMAASLILFVRSAAFGAPSQSIYGYSGETIFSLGTGFSSNDLTDKKAPCLKTTTKFTGGSTSRTVLYVLRNTSALSEIQHIDAHVEAHFVVGSASTTFNQDTSNIDNSSSISVVYHAYSQRPSEELETVSWSDPSYANLTNAEKIQTCGDRLVSKVDFEQSADVLITISNVDSKMRNAILANVSGGATFGPISAQAQTTFSNELKRAHTEHRVNLSVSSTGDAGLGASSELQEAVLKENVTLDDIGAALKSFAKRFDKVDSQGKPVIQPRPIRFYTTTMRGISNQEDPWTDAQEADLERIARAYKSARLLDTEMGALFADDPRRDDMSKSELDEVVKSEPNVRSYVESIATVHKACQAFDSKLTDCALPSCPSTLSSLCENDGTLKRPQFMPPLYHATSASFRVVVDGVLQSAISSNEVFSLSLPNNASFENRVHQYFKKASSAYGIVLLDSPYLSYVQSQVVVDTCDDPSKIHYCSHGLPIGTTLSGRTFFTRNNAPTLSTVTGLIGRVFVVFEGFSKQSLTTDPMGEILKNALVNMQNTEAQIAAAEASCDTVAGDGLSSLCTNFVYREYDAVTPKHCSYGGLIEGIPDIFAVSVLRSKLPGSTCQLAVRNPDPGASLTASMSEILGILVKDKISPTPVFIKIARRGYKVIVLHSSISQTITSSELYSGDALP